MEDVQAALAFVRCHARELEIDPARLVLWGEDTGAQLAALLASRASSGVKAMVLIGGFYDLHAAGSIPRRHPDRAPAASVAPAPRAARDAVDAVVHGTADSEVPLTQARRYCGELPAVRAACDVIEVDGASHRAENWWPSQWAYKPRIVDWLSRTLSFTAPPTSASIQPPAAIPTPRLQRRVPCRIQRSGAAGQSRPVRGRPAQRHRLFSGARPEARRLHTARSTRRDRPFPAVIIAHGGGWEAGDKVTYVTPLFEPLARAGFAWFSIDYRLTPDVLHPAQLDDLRDAIRFVRANASRFNIDPNRIALLGESASGQMVMQVAADRNATDTPVAAVVSFYGVYDFEPMVEGRGLAAALPPLAPLPPPHARRPRPRRPARAFADPPRPPRNAAGAPHPRHQRTPLGPGPVDVPRPDATRGVPHELIPLEGAPHGLENWEGHAPWMHYKTRLVTWLRDNLRSNVPERE